MTKKYNLGGKVTLEFLHKVYRMWYEIDEETKKKAVEYALKLENRKGNKSERAKHICRIVIRNWRKERKLKTETVTVPEAIKEDARKKSLETDHVWLMYNGSSFTRIEDLSNAAYFAENGYKVVAEFHSGYETTNSSL